LAQNAFIRAGFRRKISGVQWNCSWAKHPTTAGFEALNRFQKVNHFPGSWCIGRKDRLMRCIGRAKRTLSSPANQNLGVPSNSFDIVPGGWILPAEYNSWRRSAEENNGRNVFIIKPSASACGRGIRLIHKNNINTVPKDKPCVMQQVSECRERATSKASYSQLVYGVAGSLPHTETNIIKFN